VRYQEPFKEMIKLCLWSGKNIVIMYYICLRRCTG